MITRLPVVFLAWLSTSLALLSAELNLKEKPTSSDGKAIQVKVGFYVSNLGSLDQSNETFDIAGYLLASWNDPRLAFASADPNASRELDSTSIWSPSLEMVNAKTLTETKDMVSVTPDGTVYWQQRVGSTLSSDFDLHRFPFDTQNLKVVVESLVYPESVVRLIADEEKTGISEDSYVTLSEWPEMKMTAKLGRSWFGPEKTHYGRVTFTVLAQRSSGFYLWKVILPVLLISMVAWVVFWIDVKEFSTQVTIAVTNLLTIVAFLFVINDNLPRVGYLTLLDRFTLICLLGVLLVIIELVTVHRLSLAGQKERGERIHLRMRWLMPLIFMAALLIAFGTVHF